MHLHLGKGLVEMLILTKMKGGRSSVKVKPICVYEGERQILYMVEDPIGHAFHNSSCFSTISVPTFLFFSTTLLSTCTSLLLEAT